MPASRVALITGGARGMGLACAVELAREGVTVALLDLDEHAARRAAGTLPAASQDHLPLAADVTSRWSMTQAVAEIDATLGPPTILVNNAGILRSTRFLDITDAEWDAVIDVSLKGAFVCSQLCVPFMIDAGFGRIVNFSSTAGRTVSTLGGAHYTVAKTALLGLTRALALETARQGITVNAVCPGLIETDMVRETCTHEQVAAYADSFPVGRLGRPEEVAALVAFLCRPAAGYITGAAFDINGGDLMI